MVVAGERVPRTALFLICLARAANLRLLNDSPKLASAGETVQIIW